MAARGVRSAAQRFLERLHRGLGDEVNDSELLADAWIIAPHPDDEVLGCGGTIARKVGLGARVRVCFLTDGASSHASVDGTQLRLTREREATAACAKLGVPADDVIFLRFPDDGLSGAVDAAATALSELFREWPGDEVYAPHEREEPEDHRAACLVARAAIRASASTAAYLEYPVWRWNEWPWVRVPASRSVALRPLFAMRGALRSLQLARQCRWRVPVQTVLGQKREALECHASQMFGPEGVHDAPTLQSFADGELLESLFATHEIFERYPGVPQR